jgi:hypothetical protein
MILWSISNVYKEGFAATCTSKSTGKLADINNYSLDCKNSL